MKKISKEFKAGIATLLILVLFYWGFTYLKGKNLFETGVETYHATFKNINGLKAANPVLISGLTVGAVLDTYFSTDPNHKGEIVVEFTVGSDVEFSKSSVIKIQSGLMGGSSVVIVPSFKGEMAKPGDFLTGKAEPGVVSSITGRLDPLQIKIESVITHLDSVLVKTNNLLSDANSGNVKESLQSLNKTLANLEKITTKVNGKLDATLSNVNESTENLKVFSDSLSKVEIVAISNKLNKTLTDLNGITSDIKEGKGTIGKLVKDEKLYNNLEAATKELEELLKDVKERPKRFVHFSLFGKKEKAYEESKEN